MEKEREKAIEQPAVPPVALITLSRFRLFLFIALSILLLAVCGYLIFYAQEQQTRHFVEQGLESTTVADTAQILAWRTGKIQDAEAWMNIQTLKEELSQFLASPGNAGLKARIQAEFNLQARKSSYQDIQLLDSNNLTVLSLNDSREPLPADVKAQISAIIKTGSAGWTDSYPAASDNTARLGVVAPLFVKPGNQAIGSVAFIIDPAQDLYPLLQAWPLSGETSETLLVEKNGDQVIFLSSPRFQKNGALNLSINLSQQDSPFVAALNGTEGIFSGRDYRGAGVLAALKHVPDSSWYLVAQIDRREVFNLWDSQGARLTILAVGLLSVVVVLTALLWWRRQKAMVMAIAQAERDHQAVLSHFEYFIKYANDSVLLFDDSNRLVQVNDRALEDFHYRREEILGLPLDVFITTESLTEFQIKLKDILQTGVFTMEGIHKCKDGSEFPAEITARVFKIDDKTFMQTIIRDITEQKVKEAEYVKLNNSLEERVRERTTQLENANKELESFAYSISHDLRAPLNGIDSWSKALAEDYHDKLGEKGIQILNRIRSETQRLGQMVEDLLKFSRESRSELKLQDVNLTEMAQNVSTRLQQANPSRKMQLVVQSKMRVRGDPHLLEMAITNLMDNALKFTGKQPLAVILVGEIQKDGKRVFFVRDNGVGFDMVHASKLFKVFQRLHKASDFPGTGVGLATVQRIITRHGGLVWAESQVDQGATFYFTLNEETHKKEITPSNN